jgi:ferredoxin
MIGIYFSGTGNTKYCVQKFLEEYNGDVEMYSIEEEYALEKIRKNINIIFAYPIQYSSLPKIVKDFIISNSSIWSGKKIYIIVTMGLFCGDGSGVSRRILEQYGAEVIGGLHLKMPDSIGDIRALKRSLEDNKKIIKKSKNKIKNAAKLLKSGKATQEGLGLLCHMAGLFGQRLYFRNKTRNYTDKLKIDSDLCVGCGKCVKLCPMSNIQIKNGKARSTNLCTMCYRCINNCPNQAITLLGKKVIQQSTIEKYNIT